MSAIASKWAYSQPIKDPIAKNILAFLASHNFPGNKTFFSVQTISGATAYSRRSVIDNLKWLVENKYLLKESRVSESGGQQSNIYVLNIPQEYVDIFCADYGKLSTPPVQDVHPPRAPDAPPPVHVVHPNSNNINNNINKSFSAPLKKPEDQKQTTSNQPRNYQVVDNAKKHEWADQKTKSPFADVTTRSNSYDPSKPVRQDDVSPLMQELLKNKQQPGLQASKAKNDIDIRGSKDEGHAAL